MTADGTDTSVRGLLGAALLAPLVVPFAVAMWCFAAPTPFANRSAILRLRDGFGAGLVFGLPVAYLMTVAIALPIVWLWRRFGGAMNGGLIMLLGVILAVGFSRLIDTHFVQMWFGLFPLCGGATAAAFWWMVRPAGRP